MTALGHTAIAPVHVDADVPPSTAGYSTTPPGLGSAGVDDGVGEAREGAGLAAALATIAHAKAVSVVLAAMPGYGTSFRIF